MQLQMYMFYPKPENDKYEEITSLDASEGTGPPDSSVLHAPNLLSGPLKSDSGKRNTNELVMI